MAGELSLKTPSTGLVTLVPTDTATDKTITLPATTGTMVVQDGTNTTTVVNLTATGTVNVGGGNISPQTGFKNRIINGAMTIDQRNAGAAVTFAAGAGGAYVVDRFTSYRNTTGAYTLQRSSVAPAGFVNSLLMTVTATDTSIASGEVVDIAQIIEGFNISDFGWGTASAQSVTMSFWVRSSVTGVFCCAIRNGAASRSYIQQYTISASNTWQQVQLTFPGETTGTWSTDNTGGLILNWTLMAGTAFQATAGVWNTTNTIATSSQTNLMATNGATWYITGVQLEKGSTATPFEFRSIGQELALCCRYFQKSYDTTTVGGTSTFTGASFIGAGTQGVALTTGYMEGREPFPVRMRSAPTVVGWDTSGNVGKCTRFNPNTANNINSLATFASSSERYVNCVSTSGADASTIGFHWYCSAEL